MDQVIDFLNGNAGAVVGIAALILSVDVLVLAVRFEYHLWKHHSKDGKT